jgi:hypothetical protein
MAAPVIIVGSQFIVDDTTKERVNGMMLTIDAITEKKVEHSLVNDSPVSLEYYVTITTEKNAFYEKAPNVKCKIEHDLKTGVTTIFNNPTTYPEFQNTRNIPRFSNAVIKQVGTQGGSAAAGGGGSLRKNNRRNTRKNNRRNRKRNSRARRSSRRN